jgi:hypothetical protein
MYNQPDMRPQARPGLLWTALATDKKFADSPIGFWVPLVDVLSDCDSAVP